MTHDIVIIMPNFKQKLYPTWFRYEEYYPNFYLFEVLKLRSKWKVDDDLGTQTNSTIDISQV